MPTLTELTTGIQTTTTTGAVTPTTGVDISGFSATTDVTICLEITALTAAKSFTIQLEDSVNAFTTVVPIWVESFTGPIVSTGGATLKTSIKKYQMPKARFGTTSAVLRLNVMAVDSAMSISMHAWIES